MIPDIDLDTLFRERYATAKIINLASTAPRDGSPILARAADGGIDLVRWRCDVEDGAPYWARCATDEPFAFVDWLPSPLTWDEFFKIYN